MGLLSTETIYRVTSCKVGDKKEVLGSVEWLLGRLVYMLLFSSFQKYKLQIKLERIYEVIDFTNY